MEDTVAEEVLREFAQLSGDRGTWEQHWQEIAERCLPAYSNSFTPGSVRTPGEQRTEYIVDSTAQVALKRGSAVMDSLLTPANYAWHQIKPSNPELMKLRNVALWFEAANETLLRQRRAPKANFASQNLEVWTQSLAFGTGPIFVDALQGERGLRYRSIHIGEIYFAENHQGIIDRALRRFPLTARQAKQKWKDLPKQIADCPDQNRVFYFVHCIKPNAERDVRRVDYRGMQYLSYYVSETGKQTLEKGGYRTFPIPISRFTTAPGETYGRGPAMDVLPTMKTLNEMKKTVLKQGHRVVDPVILAADDGVVDTVNLTPGAVNYGGMSPDGRPLLGVLPTGNIAVGKDLMDDERLLINDAFMVTLFQILVETPQMTATEVLERVKEKGMLLAPTVGRQQSEYLGPLIERELDVLAAQGLLPPMPGELIEAKGEYRIEYDSPMARAQRAEQAAGLLRTVEQSLAIVNVTQDPSPLDNFDFDVAIPEIAEINAVPMRWMRSEESKQALRDQRAQAAKQQQAVDALPGIASVAKTMQEAPAGK